MTLADLLGRVQAALPGSQLAGGAASPDAAAGEVAEIAYDSRRVSPGAVFVAVRGLQSDGMAFVQDAQDRGAIAVVSESDRPPGLAVPWLVVEDARRSMAVLADELYDHPSEALTVVGITGTNGKTTSAYLVESIFEAAGISCGRLGTVSYRVGRDERQASITTPESPDLHRLLRGMVDHGCGASVVEVSSHALTLRRVDRVRFAAAVFTNLTRDHLDFHGDMSAYFLAKRRLFEMLPPEAIAVINLDDPNGRSLCETVRQPVTFAMSQPADVTPGPVQSSLAGLVFDVRTPRGPLHIESPLVGQLNARNVLAAVSTCMALDVPLRAIENGVRALRRVPGRFEVVSDPAEEVTVVVDYAHTDDALRHLLEAARPLAQRRLITVLGCGGDRDRTKRPLMGAVAARLSDLVIVTSDNPRSEDPQEIIEEILKGVAPPNHQPPGRGGSAPATPYLSIVDRGTAIERAVEEASPGDVVVIAGRGHETHQEVGARRMSFDDAGVTRASLARRRDRLRVP